PSDSRAAGSSRWSSIALHVARARWPATKRPRPLRRGDRAQRGKARRRNTAQGLHLPKSSSASDRAPSAGLRRSPVDGSLPYSPTPGKIFTARSAARPATPPATAAAPAAVGCTAADATLLSGALADFKAKLQIAETPSTRTPIAVEEKEVSKGALEDGAGSG